MDLFVTTTVGIIEILLILATILFYKGKQRNRQNRRNGNRADEDATMLAGAGSVDTVQFRLCDLEIATNNFSDANRLGKGGFGVVYKGLIDGKIVAIKELLHGSSVNLLDDVAKEVSLLSSLNNDYLVKLLGLCYENGRYLLVYEYISNGDLHGYLVDEKKCQTLNWEKRFKIIKGIARGLSYLHHNSENVVIHRDLKPENILLDEHYNPKIADFGLSRVFETERTHKSTSVFAGTYGYIPPELFFQQHYSTRSDVYSYGLLVLEILAGCTISGYAQANQETLSHVMWKQWKEKRPLVEVIDSSLRENCVLKEVTRCCVIGLLCIQHEPKRRPDIELVLQMLHENISLPMPSYPGFFQECARPQDSWSTFIDFQPTEDARSEDSNFFELQSLVPKRYSLKDLQIVTNNFSRRLPGGDFEYMGSVDGQTVVVEEYFLERGQLDLVITSVSVEKKRKLKYFTVTGKKFERSILPLRHPNIISILGYCFELKGRLFIISKYPTNGLLYDYLYNWEVFEDSEWRTRVQIIEGVANGICYLHNGLPEKSVIHRDIKSSNIFLDDSWNAKLFGFRYIKVLDKNQQYIDPPNVLETDGFIAPEVVSEGRLSTKSDVYSYGLVLLQILVRNIAIHPPVILKATAWMHWRNNIILEMLDPYLENNCPLEEVLRYFQIALLCIQDEPERRPSMQQVLEMLRTNDPLPMPSVPSTYAD